MVKVCAYYSATSSYTSHYDIHRPIRITDIIMLLGEHAAVDYRTVLDNPLRLSICLPIAHCDQIIRCILDCFTMITMPPWPSGS